MRFVSSLVTVTTLAAVLLHVAACSKAPAPAASGSKAVQSNSTPAPDAAMAADLEVARGAMSTSEIISALRRGVSKEELVSEVRRRRILATIVDATELELAAHGAGRQLIAALKDKANLLTEAQEKLYTQLLLARPRWHLLRFDAAFGHASEASVAEACQRADYIVTVTVRGAMPQLPPPNRRMRCDSPFVDLMAREVHFARGIHVFGHQAA